MYRTLLFIHLFCIGWLSSQKKGGIYFLAKGNDALKRQGSTAIFNCSMNVPPKLRSYEIKWYFRNHALESFERTPREKYSNRRTVMTLKKVKARDSGRYRCVVDFGDRTLEKVLDIAPTKRPYIHKCKDTHKVVDANAEVKLKCLVSSQFVTSYVWLYEGKPIRPRDGYSDFTMRKYNFLDIHQARVKDTGTYTCSVTNKFGRSEVSYSLKVKGSGNPAQDLAPQLKRNTTTAADILMNHLKLDCSSSGEPPFKVKWFKNDKPLSEMPRQSNEQYEFESRRQILVLKTLLPSDNGFYTCKVSNKYGKYSHTMEVDPVEHIANIPVFHKNKPGEGLRTFRAEIGKNLTVSAKVALFGTAHFQMLRHINVFDNKTNATTLILEVISVPRRSFILPLKKAGPAEEYRVDFYFYNITEKDICNYTIMAGNTLGYDIYPFRIIRKETPKHKVAVKDESLTSIDRSPVTIAVISSILFVLVLIIIFFIYRHCRLKKKSENNNSIINKKELQTIKLNLDPNKPTTRLSGSSMKRDRASSRLSSCQTEKEYFTVPCDEKWEVDYDNIEFLEPLGEGAFGQVMLANVYELPGHTDMQTVAVKMLKDDATDQELKDLLSEISVMKTFGKHINVINLLGVSTQSGELCLIMEYCRHGNLRSFLKQRRPVVFPQLLQHEELTLVDLVSFCLQVAKGMDYLASKKCIHRDIAARNVLVGDGNVMKIADFGLARDVHDHDYYRKFTDGRLPVKWMAMEALFDRVYTVQSDIWSFGILAWEVITFGGSPYPGIPLEKLFDLLKQGYRMEKPINCTDEMYDLMLNCWKEIPLARPSFGSIIETLENMMIQLANSDYLELQSPVYYNYPTESNSSSPPPSPPTSPPACMDSDSASNACVFEDNNMEEGSRLLTEEVAISGSYSDLQVNT